MKKLLAVLIVLGLITCFVGTYAEQDIKAEEGNEFDLSVYENAENYKYDKFEKTWDVHAMYSKEYSNAYVVFGLNIGGNVNGPKTPPYIYVWVREANNRDEKFSITGLQIIVNDERYSCKNLMVSDATSMFMLDSNVGKSLLRAMSQGDELSFKAIYSTGSLIEDITGEDYVSLKQLAKLIVDNDPWQYVYADEIGDIKAYDTIINTHFPIEKLD